MTYESKNEYDVSIDAVKSVLPKMDGLKESTQSMNFLMGFDGYIDLLYSMLKNRTSLTEYEIYTSMADYGNHVVNIAGSSGSIERVLKKKLGGGFAPNMARALGNMAPQSTVDLYAAMGYPELDPIFSGSLPKNVNMHSIGNSGETLAMEFEAGKITPQDIGGIFELTWDTILKRMGGRDAMIDAFNKADAIGNGHWSLMLSMSDYFKHFISDIFPNMDANSLKKKLFFMDPADLSNRNNADIEEVLTLLGKVNEFVPVVLSLNDREAMDVSKVYASRGVNELKKGDTKAYEKAGIEINEQIQIDYLAIHDPHFATISSGDSHEWVTEGYTSKPSFTVAAGDHFNGALLMSLLSGLSPSESLVVANSATAFFVRTGESPSPDELHTFVGNYFEYINNDHSKII